MSPGLGRRRRSLRAKLVPNLRHHSRMLSCVRRMPRSAVDQLNVAQAQAETTLQPDRVADDRAREAVAAVQVGHLVHTSSPTLSRHSGQSGFP